jgi:hypothetical protein
MASRWSSRQSSRVSTPPNDLLWVAVPNGLRPSSKASIRVLVVPRLATGTIQEAGLGDWPAILRDQITFSMRTRTSLGERTATHPLHYVERARSEVWVAFFTGDAGLINGYEPKVNPVPTVTQTYHDAQRVTRTYRSVTRSAADRTTDVNSTIRLALREWEESEPPQPARDAEPPAFTTPDFHSTISMLREHPTVLVDLGLVFELIVDVADLNVGTAAPGRQLSIRCLDAPFLNVTSPWTRYDLTNTGFRPAPAPGSNFGIQNGMLDLSDSASITAPVDATRWALPTFDVEGAVGNLRQIARDIAANPGVTATMPAMRSIGLALLRPNRRLDFAARARAAADRAAASMAETVLAAEDLVLGYRVDIRRGAHPWRSLCERDVKYKVNGISIGTSAAPNGFLREEGHVKPFTAVKVKPFAALNDADGALYADEVVLRWDGWSLAVPRPNLRADTSGPARESSHPLPYQFEWRFEIPRNPGRLPALRFSGLYQVRIRIADITGGGLSLDDVDSDDAASAAVLYRRHDPIQPPQLRAAGQFAPGAAIDRLVIRSDEGMTPEQLHQADPDYPAKETRTLDPPAVSLQLVEQHGRLDGETDERSFELAQRAMRADAAETGLPDWAAEGVNAFIPVEPGGLTHSASDRSDWTPAWPDQAPKNIELADQENPAVPITLKWQANTLKVTLAKGKQATIELSSTIREGLEDHLATSDYFSNPPIPQEDAANTMLGRNPVITPPRRILVVHAVKRPRAEPLWNVPLVIERGPGDTSAVLKPTFTPVDTGQGLNTDSTGRLDVAAEWTEFKDIGAEAGSGERPISLTHLHSQSIERGDSPSIRIRHEFGDTKHRSVTYTLNATTRFREYFKPTEPESSFQLSRKQKAVNILSAARPPAPVVLGVVPAFRWTRTQTAADRLEHTRQAQRLRVELARPWFQTGGGEQLALVLAPGDASVAAASDLVTRIGRDPLFGTPATPPRPKLDWFPSSVSAQLVKLPELNAQVTVIPFDVNAGGDRWYAEIEFAVPPAARSYNPFVQLAVARYQRNSLDEMQISPVVITDRVPLLPDRHVIVTRVGSQLKISVEGTSPNPLNWLEAILETCDRDMAPEAIDFVVEAAGAEPQVPAWRPVPGGSVVRTADGSIPPLTLVRAPGRLRVRLRETENLGGSDASSPSDLLRRNVFVDTIILPAGWQPT